MSQIDPNQAHTVHANDARCSWHCGCGANGHEETAQKAREVGLAHQIAGTRLWEATLWRDSLHRITERADGPNLDDLLNLIRYLRKHDLNAHVVHYNDAKVLAVDLDNGWGWHEGGPLGDERFVGPDGTVYDEKMEAL